MNGRKSKQSGELFARPGKRGPRKNMKWFCGVIERSECNAVRDVCYPHVRAGRQAPHKRSKSPHHVVCVCGDLNLRNFHKKLRATYGCPVPDRLHFLTPKNHYVIILGPPMLLRPTLRYAPL